VEKREEDGHYYHRNCKGEFIGIRTSDLRCDSCKTVAVKVTEKKSRLFSSKEPIRRCVGLLDLDDDEMMESFEAMSDKFKERAKIVCSNLDDSGDSNGGVGVKREEENSEIGSRKRRLGEDGENIVARDNRRIGDGNGRVFSRACEETFKTNGSKICCIPCGEMRRKLNIKKRVLKDSKRRKLNRPMIRCGGIYRMDADELTLEAFKFYRKRFGRKVKKKENGVYHSWKCEEKFEKGRNGNKIRCNECAKYSKKIMKKKDSLTRKRKRENIPNVSS